MNRIALAVVVLWLSSCAPAKAGDPCGASDEWKASSCDGAEWVVCSPDRKFEATGCIACATTNGVARCEGNLRNDAEKWGLPGETCDSSTTLGYCAGTSMVACESGKFVAHACSSCSASNVSLACAP